MNRRTTIEIDGDLLERARRALGRPTMRATVEEALRRAVAGAEAEHDERSRRQAQYLESLGRLADLSVLGSDEMWR